MKTTSSVLALALATISSAAPAIRAEQPTDRFFLTNLEFTGHAHSNISTYKFNLTDNSGAQVYCYTTNNASPDITFFPETRCSDPTYTFSWDAYQNSPDAGNQINVTHYEGGAPGGGVRGNIVLSHDDVPHTYEDGVWVGHLDAGNGGSGKLTLDAYPLSN